MNKEVRNLKSIEKGAEQVIQNCLGIRPWEKVVIITDMATQKISAVVEKVVRQITGNIQIIILEDFGPRPLTKLPDVLPKILSQNDISLFIAQDAPGECQNFRRPMLKIIDNCPKLRHAHMIGINSQIMRDGMCSDYKKIQKISRYVYDIVKNAATIHVTTCKGTDIIAQFSSSIKWEISDGNITTTGHWSNLPDGEVFTTPERVDGKVIIDGGLGGFERYGLLDKTPVSLTLKNGRVKRNSIKCVNNALTKDLVDNLFHQDENSKRIGEFAIGTNIGLTKLIGNVLQDEKFPGIHIAFGDPCARNLGAGWTSNIHIDAIIQKPSIIIDDKIILMNEGKFVFE